MTPTEKDDLPSSPPQPPFQLGDNQNEILFQDVYYNGFHSLKQLEIVNLTNEPLVIHLDSTLQDQLAFQLENENIKDLNLTYGVATNTAAAWATTNTAASQFNQLFNYVNHTDQIELAATEKRTLVLAFLPLNYYFNTTSSTATAAVFQTITGNVFFRSNNYLLDVNFEATVCQSILVADELDTGLIFEDSLVGETYIKDITIRNLSAIDLYWKLNTLDLVSIKNNNRPSSSSSSSIKSSNSSNGSSSSMTSPTVVDDWLQFVDASTFITLDHDNLAPIPAFSHYTFRVIFTPKEVGKFNYDLQIENCNDVRNIIQTKIHATMRSFVHRDTLVVTSGNVLDFGDCVSGTWNMQQIVLNNISESPIEIHFVADGAELGFDIMVKSEEEDSAHSNNPLVLLSPPATSSASFSTIQDSTAAPVHPESPTTSHKTLGSTEEYSSTNSYASTDVDHIDMLTAFNEVYSTNNSSMVTATTSTTSSIQQVVVTTEQFNTRIEYMVLKPGVEKVIQASYRPPKDEPSSVYAGQFIRQNFNILLEYRPNKSATPMEHKLIQCKAKTCTSFVDVTPHIIDFGYTDVGTQRSLPIKITNRSEICAHVELVFVSKVLNCTQGEILMQPKSTVELKLDIYPRKVNASYKRQITLVNFLNRDNDQIIEVSSNNIDKHRVTFHSLFYRILTPTGANFLDFGPIALNSPAIRTCTIVNIRDASLLLGVTTSSQQEIVIYTKKKRTHHLKKTSHTTSGADGGNESSQSHTNKIAASVTDTLLAKNRRSTRMTNGQYISTAYLDLATVPQHIKISSIKQKRHMATNMAQHKPSSLMLQQQKEEKSRAVDMIDKRREIGTTTITASTTATNVVHPSSSSNTAVANQKTVTTTIHHQQGKRFKKKKQQHTCVGITGTSTTAAQLKKVHKNIDWPDIAGKSRVPLDDLISILEHGSLSRTPLFARQSLEEQFVRYQLAWRTELNRLIEKGEIVPTSLLQLSPKEEEEIIIVYTPSTAHHSLTSKNTASISFRLIDYDQSVIITSDEEEEEEQEEEEAKRRKRYYKDFIPVLRKVIVRAQVCKSSMELGQKNINFGLVERGERHSKTIVLHNKSETPLLYTIKRSGSIASGDIDFGVGRHGVIRAFGKREIEFTFEPTLPGAFMEQLEVINIRDKEDKNTISLKAMVRRPESFTIKTSTPELVFHAAGGEKRENVTVTNTTKQPRMFEIRLADENNNNDHPPLLMDFSLLTDNKQESLSKEEEEEIENLEQKLKIATRKNQPDKMQKYINKLAKLKKLQEQDITLASSSTTTEEIQEQDITSTLKTTTTEEVEGRGSVANKVMMLKQQQNRLLFSLDPNASKSISICFNPSSTTTNTEVEGQVVGSFSGALVSGSSTIGGRILVHENKNIDHVKVIPFSVNFTCDIN